MAFQRAGRGAAHGPVRPACPCRRVLGPVACPFSWSSGPVDRRRRRSLVLVVQQPALLGQHPLGPRRRIPQLHPVDGPVHQHLGARAGRTSAGGRGSACAPAGRSRPRPSWTPRSGPGCGRRAPRPPSPASLPSAARTPRASTARGSPRSSGSGSRRARTGRGTSRAGSPCPSCRANARTSLRSLPPALSPTTLPGLRPLTPPHTTSRHFTPFSSTSQPPRPPATQLQPPALPARPPARRGRVAAAPRDGHRAAPFRSLPAASAAPTTRPADGPAGTVPPDSCSRAEEEQPEEEETKSGGEKKRRRERSEEERAGAPTPTLGAPSGGGAVEKDGERAQQEIPHTLDLDDGRIELGQARRPVAPGRAPARRARHRRSPPAPEAARDPSADMRRTRTRRPPAPATARGPPPSSHRGRPRRARARRSTRARRAPRHRAAGVHVEAVLPDAGQRRRPPCPDPFGRDGHVQHPERVVPRYPGVEPELLPRPEEDGSSPAPPPGQLHAPLPHRDAARRAPSAGCCPAPGSGGTRRGRRPPAAPRHGTARRRREKGWEGAGRQPQEAAARYGSHNGSTSARWRSRQRCPSGGAGLTRSVQPSSERS